MSSADTAQRRHTHFKFRRVLTSVGTRATQACNTLFLKRDAGCTGIIIFFTFLKPYLSHIYLFGCARSVSLAHTMGCGI